MTTRQRLPKVERRRVIEDAASELFAARGYSATKLEDIAAAAGVTKQLLYQHFSSKKELHMALLAKHRDGLLGRLAAGMATAGPLAERIPRVTDDWFAYVEENPFASAMLFRDTTGDPEVQKFYRELQASARGANVALLRAEPELHVPDDRIELKAEFIRAAIVGLALWWTDHPDVPRSMVVDVAVDTLMNGLGLRR
ncbi:MAG: TetR/AcrR family transcriptional regulator [Thermoleophilaceae bacterium]